MKHILASKQLRIIFLVLAGFIVVFFLANIWGLRFNLTASFPKGLYREVAGIPDKDDLVSFCLQGKYAQLAFDRGYVGPGSCANGLRPLLKRLAKLPGDYIVVPEKLLKSPLRHNLGQIGLKVEIYAQEI